MTARKKQIRYNIIAFAILFLASLYRQISLRLWPGDPFRTSILFLAYALLAAAWAVSLRLRVTQAATRRFLILEDSVMLGGMALRFVQDTFWAADIPLMRSSGLWLAATLVPCALLNFYSAYGIGQADDYRPPRQLFWLIVPTLLLCLGAATDEHRHFFYFIVPQEPQPNLIFHPGPGVFLIYGAGFALLIARVFVIYRRNAILAGRPALRRAIPFLEPALLLIVTLPSLIVTSGLWPELAGVEVLELFAKIYYVEALTSEAFIYLGLIPTNSDYSEIFRCSSAAMQIICRDGTGIRSDGAPTIPPEQLSELRRTGQAALGTDSELRLYPLRDACFIWKNDIAELNRTIAGLSRSAQALKQEGSLLAEELKTKNEETGLRLQNQIYDELAKESGRELRMMQELARNGETDDESLRRLFLLGTLVKRRCSLSLTLKETGAIPEADLRLALADVAGALELLGIRGACRWLGNPETVGEPPLRAFDRLEEQLEQQYPRLRQEALAIGPSGLSLRAADGSPLPAPESGER